MRQALILYSSVDGQTLRIAERIQQHCLSHHAVKLLSIEQASAQDLAESDKILIGASIRYGHYRPELCRFIERHQQRLNQCQSGFFNVNLVARKANKNRPNTNPYMVKFLIKSPWQPKLVWVLAGRINFPALGWFDKRMIQFILWMTKGPTDTRQSYEFTDWQSVDDLAEKFAQL
ncbi:menaquinone-dependent protoporphyrinogen IX dehydrogenase [Shewanella sp. NIFS-20-20]|uniref:menaquinone-dependent protoporphyrinogen IX dehydrogenase n=1 Tax=Shewanella sp. NIFS-20-20 TaxID=2853806 RepID=UPI001C464569|nr:menaquinone-dependent protoporphyrinogen IX dehydrogenase [Shewanella sp. NIFS-20-20]MBV7315571.1 menaquinone-dependent protoporphyrinogen IX dehydrogenase [Shewanella sp. NIFS-20-20]